MHGGDVEDSGAPEGRIEATLEEGDRILDELRFGRAQREQEQGFFGSIDVEIELDASQLRGRLHLPETPVQLCVANARAGSWRKWRGKSGVGMAERVIVSAFFRDDSTRASMRAGRTRCGEVVSSKPPPSCSSQSCRTSLTASASLFVVRVRSKDESPGTVMTITTDAPSAHCPTSPVCVGESSHVCEQHNPPRACSGSVDDENRNHERMLGGAAID